MAGTAALNEKLSNGGDLGSLYNQAYAVYGGAQDRFRQESPGTALATDLSGSIAATAASGAGLGVAGNALLDAVNGSRAAAPPLAAAGNFLTGAAGGGSGAAAPATRLASRGAAAGGFGGAINTGLTPLPTMVSAPCSDGQAIG